MKLKTDKPKKAAPAPKPTVPQRKGIINRILHIVIEDIRYMFGRRDTRSDIEKAREQEMIYKGFRERFG